MLIWRSPCSVVQTCHRGRTWFAMHAKLYTNYVHQVMPIPSGKPLSACHCGGRPSPWRVKSGQVCPPWTNQAGFQTRTNQAGFLEASRCTRSGYAGGPACGLARSHQPRLSGRHTKKHRHVMRHGGVSFRRCGFYLGSTCDPAQTSSVTGFLPLRFPRGVLDGETCSSCMRKGPHA